MEFDDGIRDRVILLGGEVAGVDCPDCEFDGDVDGLEAHVLGSVECPVCESTILTADQKSQLRRSGKL